jgi:hypothetical protein
MTRVSVFLAKYFSRSMMDCRVKPGNDGVQRNVDTIMVGTNAQFEPAKS